MSVLIRELLRNYNRLEPDTKIDLDKSVGVLIGIDELDPEDIAIIEFYKLGHNLTVIAELIGRSRRTVLRRLKAIVDKVGNEMGEPYLNDSIIRELQRRLGRSLNERELVLCRQIINTFSGK
jgi:hypothetical protein